MKSFKLFKVSFVVFAFFISAVFLQTHLTNKLNMMIKARNKFTYNDGARKQRKRGVRKTLKANIVKV